ncbi:hypothetical protein [Pseudovibrio exalbescens]|uniref:Uncharacterized protein n=1 Tax=Pseudovibrio exalbescens TaxID=197461 RepID=A0A1U7JFS4_9HYPH|nr:hypothetical protein [Pseudovibrio exalbescens]OKL43567.1 hypothetical protein A3843_13105 [Pseudovibrio exalbescens]
MSDQNTKLQDSRDSGFPLINGAFWGTVILSGVAAVTVWEIWARFVTPLWVGGPLQAEALVQSVFGFNDFFTAEMIHLLTGIVVFPLVYLLVARPFLKVILPQLPWWVIGLGFGFGLWVFALYFMAHLVGGSPAFLDFIPLVWASLVGHALYGLVTAFVARFRGY